MIELLCYTEEINTTPVNQMYFNELKKIFFFKFKLLALSALSLNTSSQFTSGCFSHIPALLQASGLSSVKW